MQGGGFSAEMLNKILENVNMLYMIYTCSKKGMAIRDVHISLFGLLCQAFCSVLDVKAHQVIRSALWESLKKCGLKPMAVACYRNPCY